MKIKILSIMMIFAFGVTNAVNLVIEQDCNAYANTAASAEIATYSLWQQLASLNNGDRELLYNYYYGFCEGSNAAGVEALQPVFVNVN